MHRHACTSADYRKDCEEESLSLSARLSPSPKKKTIEISSLVILLFLLLIFSFVVVVCLGLVFFFLGGGGSPGWESRDGSPGLRVQGYLRLNSIISLV